MQLAAQLEHATYEELLALDEQRRGAKPAKGASKAKIADKTTTHKAKAADLEDQDGQENTCVICMDAFKKRQALRELPCKHRFHKGCIDKWLKRVAECPICKEKI